MTYCSPCDRRFNSYNAFQQHMDNSTAHSHDDDEWECEVCDRSFATKRARHQHYSMASGHPYCAECERMFMNENCLRQHLHSRIHTGQGITCPFCKNNYATASGLTIHLESGSCSSGLNRAKVNDIVQRMDQNNVITRPLLTYQGSETVETIATDRAWNGHCYECYFCDKGFNTLRALNQHMQSPAHEQHLYRCPGTSCGRTYKVLSGLVQHVESESCGVMRFAMVQKQAQGGIQNMVGRMIMS